MTYSYPSVILYIAGLTEPATKEKAIASFLELPDFQLVIRNVGQYKDYKQTYEKFISSIRIPESYVDIMSRSDYVQHFYTQTEIEAVRSAWCERTEKIELPPTVHQALLLASRRETRKEKNPL